MIIESIWIRRCPYCRKKISFDMTECLACRASYPSTPRIEVTPRGDICIAPFTYDGVIAAAMKDYKFRGVRFNSKSFAGAIVSAMKKTYFKDMDFEIITSVPATRKRKRLRGYNQAELIARRIAELTGTRYEELLTRDVETVYQHYLGLEERKKHSKNYYSIIDKESVRNKKILLVDDIMTSGTTLSSCSEVLMDADAQRVFCAVTAITKKR